MEAFANLTDPRNGKAKLHYFGEILFIALAAMICGMEGFDDFARFAQLREKWLRKHLKLPSGTPSDDTFRRIFTALDPKNFLPCFIAYVTAVRPDLTDELIAIDGKTLRHSFDDGRPGCQGKRASRLLGFSSGKLQQPRRPLVLTAETAVSLLNSHKVSHAD